MTTAHIEKIEENEMPTEKYSRSYRSTYCGAIWNCTAGKQSMMERILEEYKRKRAKEKKSPQTANYANNVEPFSLFALFAQNKILSFSC